MTQKASCSIIRVMKNGSRTPTLKLKLYDILVERNLTVAELSKATGLTKSALYMQLNRNPRAIRLDTLAKICHGLGIDPNTLLELTYTEVPK